MAAAERDHVLGADDAVDGRHGPLGERYVPNAHATAPEFLEQLARAGYPLPSVTMSWVLMMRSMDGTVALPVTVTGPSPVACHVMTVV